MALALGRERRRRVQTNTYIRTAPTLSVDAADVFGCLRQHGREPAALGLDWEEGETRIPGPEDSPRAGQGSRRVDTG